MKLPSLHELTTEQDIAFTMPLEGNHLVTGPPGSGKTVMALYRAQALAIDDRPSTVLMHSNVLKQYVVPAAATLGPLITVETFHRWIRAFWKNHYDGTIPQLGDDPFSYDWKSIIERFVRQPPARDTVSYLLVDEGQDLSPEFYQLATLMALNITVFADENQKLFPDNSTLEEIQRALGRQTQVHALSHNYRNTREIARLAAQFFCGTPTGTPVPPERHGNLPSLRHSASLSEFLETVVKYQNTVRDRTIGIVAPTARVQKEIYDRLNRRALRHRAQAYLSSVQNHAHIDFTTPGIKILNYWTIKGLDFDTLFVPELQHVPGETTSTEQRMRFYVALSRARHELFLGYSGHVPEPWLVTDIPRHILERR
jgi:superfamily I DNA/RNA helicase